MSAPTVKAAESVKIQRKTRCSQQAAFTAFATEAACGAFGTAFVLMEIREERKCDDVPKCGFFC
jgi:hypothetical protein